jgi:hypothetical protein
MPRQFLTDRGGLPPIPAPASVRKRGHPLVSLALLQSSSCLRRPRLMGAPSLGFRTSSRRQFSESTADGQSQARLCSARSVSHALDGLLLAVPCRLVSSCSHVQVSRFRVSSPNPSGTTSSVALAFAPLAPFSCRRLPDDAGERRVDLKAFSRPGSAAPTRCLAPHVARVPSCVPAPSGSRHQS